MLAVQLHAQWARSSKKLVDFPQKVCALALVLRRPVVGDDGHGAFAVFKSANDR